MTTVRRAAGAVWRSIPDGVLVRVPGPAAEALLLTATTAEVWRSLDVPRPLVALDANAVDALLATGLATVLD